MKEIYINADDYNSDSIRTIQGNNNAEEYKIYLQYDNEKIDLTGKTVNLGFLRVGSTEGDIIENLNVTNPKEGEITLKITNKISKRNGTYSCQLAILGEGDFLEHTATFTLTVENNIFSDITKAIADSKDFTYLENILDKASKLSEKLKENTSSATNANSNLESNIIEANNINSKILENTANADSLNKNLESNIDLAKQAKETIKDLNSKNTEATEKIGTLTSLNSKATELSNNINESLSVKDSLIKNTESAKIINNELIATNNDVKVKKTDLDNSLEEAKKYISGLDGSKNPVQMQLDINELKNGLKSNQSLSYEGSNIAANNTLEGRTEGMRIGGRTLQNLCKKIIPTVTSSGSLTNIQDIYKCTANGSGLAYLNFTLTDEVKSLLDGNKKYTIFMKGYKLINPNNDNIRFYNRSDAIGTNINKINDSVLTFTTPSDFNGSKTYEFLFYCGTQGSVELSNEIILLEGDWTGKKAPEYFEGIKSFGESEQEGDKYKISILSHGKNIYNGEDLYIYKPEEKWRVIDIPNIPKFELGKTYKVSYKTTESVILKIILTYENNEDAYSSSESPLVIAKGKGKVTRLRFYIEESDYSTNKKFIITNIQIEEGTQVTPYEPYKSDKKDILIKEPLHEGNYLYEDNGQVKVYKEAKKYIFNGDENWSKHSNSGNGLFVAIIWDGFSDCSPTSSVICNKLKNERTTSKENVIYFVSKCPIITVSEKTIGGDTVEHFKTWLKSNPIEIIYQLATPTVEVVENCVDIDLDTYQDKTYFSINNTIPGTLDFKVPSNLGSSLQNLAKEVNNIWDVINNLLVPSILDVNKKVTLATIKNNLK
ncbi:BppU family phage baseplate upper protein [Clostridium perfringens]|uniref:BppU family phage baseplate upper protein n=1 Tax=Clostridium perfringens TaxID=1502 RepID=UPI0018E4D0DB|nr:BppU family phage baseplate upper protein [Clostridium perfringens]MBI6069395.1 BppU family phage baseplate upper protein [Clostridium perfringens]MBI6097574.1 BppU family phage baseplate upper protein [Clostridium perfringens]